MYSFSLITPCENLISMVKTLERYQKCNYGAPEPNVSAREALVNGYFYTIIFYVTFLFVF